MKRRRRRRAVQANPKTHHFTLPVLILVSLLINILLKVNLFASTALATANLDEVETVNERERGTTAEIIENIINSFMIYKTESIYIVAGRR